MEKDVHQMKSPWLKSEEMIIKHIDDMHHRPVIIGGSRIFFKLPDTFGKDLRNVFNAFNPVIPKDLAVIVMDKTIKEGVEKYCKSDERYNDNKDCGDVRKNFFILSVADEVLFTVFVESFTLSYHLLMNTPFG